MKHSSARLAFALLVAIVTGGCSQEDPTGQPAGPPAPAVPTAGAGASGVPTAGAAGSPMGPAQPVAGPAGAPPAMPGEAGTGSGVDPAQGPTSHDADYYPLEDGAEWAYRHTGGTLPWTEVVNVRAIDRGGMPAFEVRDTAGPSGVRSVQVLVREGALTRRVHSEEFTDDVASAVIDYDPGFARFDHGWLDLTAGASLTLDYQRVERDAAGVLVTDELRSHRYDMLAMSQTVTVPAGTFDGCLQVKRQRMVAAGAMPMPGDIETFWFCPGVGKVKEIEDLSGKVEELERCSLPACTQ